MIFRYALVALFSLAIYPVVFAQTTYFQQDFSAGAPLSQYFQSSNPSNTQFNGIAGSAEYNLFANITDGALEFDRQQDPPSTTAIPRGYAVRTTDFSPAPTSLYVQFRFQVLSTSKPGANAVKFYVGSGFGNSPAPPTNGNVYARFAIDIQSSNSFAMNPLPSGGGGANSQTFSGWQTITFILNKAGNTLRYLTPAGNVETQPVDTYDLWVGNTRVFDNQPVLTASQSLTDFKLGFDDGISKIQVDDFLIRDINGVLPVTLTSFTAKPVGKQVQLAWETTAERDASHFVVERSRDLGEYVPVGEVAARGTTNQRQQYSLLDEQPFMGTNYYRLKQVDRDGTTTYSKVVAAVLDDSSPSLELLGNPADGQTIRVATRNLFGATYRLTTPAGAAVPFDHQLGTDGTLTLTPHGALPPGLYFLRAQSGNVRLVRKVMVR